MSEEYEMNTLKTYYMPGDTHGRIPYISYLKSKIEDLYKNLIRDEKHIAELEKDEKSTNWDEEEDRTNINYWKRWRTEKIYKLFESLDRLREQQRLEGYSPATELEYYRKIEEDLNSRLCDGQPCKDVYKENVKSIHDFVSPEVEKSKYGLTGGKRRKTNKRRKPKKSNKRRKTRRR